MSVKAYLEDHLVFSIDEFRSEMGEGRTPYNLLVRAVNKGLADRVMRGIYVSRSGRFTQTTPDPYVIASAVSEDVVILYHSALELHGLAHSPTRRIQFSSSRIVSDFRYRDIEFKRYDHPQGADAVFSTMLVHRPAGLVRVTTRERTLVDCINRMDLSGGAEEVSRSLASLPYVDAHNVLAYLKELASPVAAARTGWFLEQRAQEWYVSESALNEIKDMLRLGPYYLTRDHQAGVWDPSWRLYLPADEADIRRWVNE